MAFEAQFIAQGDMIDYTPGANVAAGEVVALGAVAAVAKVPIPANTKGALAVRGLFNVAKTAGLAVSLGDAIYFNLTTRLATKTATDLYLGIAAAAALAADARVIVHLRSIEALAAEALAVGELSDLTLTAPAAGDLLLTQNGSDWVNGKIGHSSIGDVAQAAVGPVLLKRAALTFAAPGDQNVITNSPRKLLLVKAWMVSRDTNAANVKLHIGTAGADDTTEAKAKGAVADAVVDFGTLVAAKDEVPAAGALKANATAACVVDVFVLCVPIA